MNRRWMCGDIWLNILPFFDYAKLGLNLALLSDRFDVLVDAHFDGKKEFTLWRCIRINKGEGPKAKLTVLIDGTFVDFPLPDHPLPNKIRFRFLLIVYIDRSVIEFLRSNKQIWDRMGTKLEFNVHTTEIEDVQQIWDRKCTKLDLNVWSNKIEDIQPIWDVLASEIWPVFSTNIRHLCFDDGHHLDNLRRRTSPTLLTDCDQLISIDSCILCPDWMADDGPNASAGQVLAKWLQTPTKNGQSKRLRCSDLDKMEINNWFDNHKQAFLRATTSVAYNMRITFYKPTRPIGPFELVNERTNEKLTLMMERDRGDQIGDWLLKRCPISEKEAVIQLEGDENWDNNLNTVQYVLWGSVINLIGPLSPPPAEEEKEAEQSIEMSSDCAEVN